MTKDELLTKLQELAKESDCEAAHIEADDALLAFINDADVSNAFNAIEKWYA